MVSPVSIGDAIALSKLAYSIGRAFSSGRASAPAEFHEVQNQLFALGGALGLVANDRSEHKNNPTRASAEVEKALAEQDEVLQQMIPNCKETLAHLESLLEKYMDIDPNAKTDKKAFSKWKEGVKKNYKKIKWTTEGGDLDKLRDNLSVHVTGMTLALSAIHSSQTHKVETKVDKVQDMLEQDKLKADKVHDMLEEIYVWYQKNLKASKAAPSVSTVSKDKEEGFATAFELMSIDEEPQLRFEVHLQLPNRSETALICPRASFERNWIAQSSEQPPRGIFRCNCRRDISADELKFSTVWVDHGKDLRFSLVLPTSLIVQVAGVQNLWQLYVLSRASNGTISLIIGGIAPSSLAAFTKQVEALASHQSQRLQYYGERNTMLMHYTSTSTVYVREDDESLRLVEPSYLTLTTKDGELRVLEAKCDVKDLDKQIATATFVKPGVQFEDGFISAVEILRYRLVAPSSQELQPLGGTANTTTSPQDFAELILRSRGGISGIQQYVVYIKRDTHISQPKPLEANISGVDVLAERQDAKPNDIRSIDIHILFKRATAATKFHDSLLAMQRALHVSYARFPQPNETIVFQKPAGDLMIRDFYIPDATLTVTSSESGERRMILLSSDTSIGVSMKLPTSFLQDVQGHRTKEYPATFVKIGWDTTTIMQQPIELKMLLPSDLESQRQIAGLLERAGGVEPKSLLGGAGG